jgi:hypothetical protein
MHVLQRVQQVIAQHYGWISKCFRKGLFMKKNRIPLFILFFLLATLLASAHDVTASQPVAALAGTDGPTEVITPLPTSTPTIVMPTATLIPATPTPSRMEFSVRNASVEVRVLGIEKPHQVFLGIDSSSGTDIIYHPGAGNMFLGLGIKVTNFTGSDILMKWSDVYLVNKYQDKWYPVWGAYKPFNAALDPLTIEILKSDQVHPDFDPDAHFYLSDNSYVRVIFQIPRDNLYYYFGFADLPQIEINWRYD